MTVLPTILTASDFSKSSTLALKRAASLALDLNIRLELLHVVEDSLLDHFFQPEQKAREKSRLAEAAMHRLREEAEREMPAGVEYRCRVETGRAFLAIIHTARLVQAGLIVVAAHGRHSLRDLFIGTTTEKVVRKADLPVLVVKNAPRASYRRVLVPTDFSAAAGNALAAAMTLAPDALIDPLHVYTLWGGEYLTSPTIRDAAQERYQREMRSKVSSAMTDWLRGIETGDRRLKEHIRQGRAAALIPKVAKELGVDLVAMGTTGRSGLSHVLLGSVAEHALWQLPCDLLTVRPAGFRFELP